MQQRVGLIGFPVGHSISPAMQQAALDLLRIPATYELWETRPEEIPARIDSLRAPEILGANVTVPHKLRVMEHLDEVSAPARLVGAVNTIINRDGRLIGENTDVPGLAQAISETGFRADRDSTSVLLGAGGAARAAILAMSQTGIGSISIHNRTTERAQFLAEEFAASGTHAIATPSALEDALRSASVVLNATSIGWEDGSSPLSVEQIDMLRDDALVIDLTYRETPFLSCCRQRNLHVLDGLPMLVYQGAKAFEIWTGQDAPVETMMATAVATRDR